MAMHHQKLIVYQRALDFVVQIHMIIRTARPGWADLCNQLKRAATSIVLNIAEGSAEYSRAEKVRFYRIALRSGAEAHAACDVMIRAAVVGEREVSHAQSGVEEIVAMLVAMCKEVEARR